VRTKDLKRSILRVSNGEEFYGYEVHRKLMREGVRIEISRLYRVLNAMLKENYLTSGWERSAMGPRRRVYKIGRKGAAELNIILLEAIGTVHEYYGKYLMRLPAKTNALNRTCRLLTRGLERTATIGYLACDYSPIYEKVIHILCNIVPRGEVYFIKPASLGIDLRIENLSCLDGTYQNIQLKNSHLDALLVVDVPSKKFIKNSVKEWHRVIRRKGRLGIITPTALMNKIKDPLTIGDFMEKYEHEAVEEIEKADRESLETTLRESFQKIETRHVASMTLTLASEPKPNPS
jgi:DNA-binding PadR family transcriptional regulator/ribosomal protein L36